MKKVEIFTDGACSCNPGPGGWGAVLRYKGTEKEISGGERNTTNNRMELTGVIEALKLLREPCEVKIRCRRPFKRLGKELEGKGLEEKRQQACVKSGPVGGAFKALRYPQGHRSMGQGSRLPPGKRTLRPTGCRRVEKAAINIIRNEGHNGFRSFFEPIMILSIIFFLFLIALVNR